MPSDLPCGCRPWHATAPATRCAAYQALRAERDALRDQAEAAEGERRMALWRQHHEAVRRLAGHLRGEPLPDPQPAGGERANTVGRSGS